MIKQASSAQTYDKDTFRPNTVHLSHKLCDKSIAVSNPKIILKNIITLFVPGRHVFLYLVTLRHLQFWPSSAWCGTVLHSCALPWLLATIEQGACCSYHIVRIAFMFTHAMLTATVLTAGGWLT